MKQLSLSQKYAIIALDNEPIKHYTIFTKRKVIGLIAAIILELLEEGAITKDNRNQLSVCALLEELPPYSSFIYAEIQRTQKPKTIKQWMKYFSHISRKKKYAITKAITDTLLELDVMTYGHDLLESDYNYTTSGVTIWVYIANKEQYTCEIENIRAEFLEQGNISDNTLILTWLLEECDILYTAFSKLERPDVTKRLYDLYNTDLYKDILCNFRLDGGIINSIARGFLTAKSNFFESNFGSYFWEVFPYFNLRTSVAISMDQYLPSQEQRLLQVISELKKKGHTCRVIDSSTIEVDNKRYLMYLTSGNRVQIVRLREII